MAGEPPERIEALAQPALERIGPHGGRLRRRRRVSGVPVHRHLRTLTHDGVLVLAGLSLVNEQWGVTVAILTEDMKRLVREQGLGFYATVCEDGSPNLSPKGTTRVWDDDHLFLATCRAVLTQRWSRSLI